MRAEAKLPRRGCIKGPRAHLGQIADRPAMTPGSPLVRFAASPLPFPAARQKEATGFSESLEGIFREPQQGHTRRFTALPVTATWRTMPMVTRYSPRWHANQTRFYFSACEPSPPRPLRRGVRLSQSETWCREAANTRRNGYGRFSLRAPCTRSLSRTST